MHNIKDILKIDNQYLNYCDKSAFKLTNIILLNQHNFAFFVFGFCFKQFSKFCHKYFVDCQKQILILHVFIHNKK